MSISVCYSVAKSCPTHCYPIAAARQASLFFTISWSWLTLMPIELVMLSNHLIVCRALLLLSSNFPSTKVFSNELTVCIRWLKYWSFSISPSNECSGLISFRIRLVYCLLAVERALKSLLRYHNLKASFLQHCLVFINLCMPAKYKYFVFFFLIETLHVMCTIRSWRLCIQSHWESWTRLYICGSGQNNSSPAGRGRFPHK